MYKKSCQQLGAYKKARKFIDRDVTLRLYESLILPLVDQCEVVYLTAAAVPKRAAVKAKYGMWMHPTGHRLH